MQEMTLQHQIEELNKKVDKILFVIIGDDELAQQGLVKKVESHEKWIQEKKLHDAKVVAISTIVSGIAMFLINFYGTFK